MMDQDMEDDIDPMWICCICSEEPFDDSPLVYCDGEGCSLAVHPECYGTPLSTRIPDEEWYCDTCSAKGKVEDEKLLNHCSLCPQRSGALKRTTDGRWAHVRCAMWVPEAFFRLPEGKEAIDLLRIPSHRWRSKCYLCKQVEGACVKCSEKGCSKAFHVSCGMDHNLLFAYKERDNVPDVVFTACKLHTEKWRARGE